jgi:starch synthase
MESLEANTGFGLHDLLRARGAAFSGVLNGIDTNVWDPSRDIHLSHHYDSESRDGKGDMRRALAAELGWDPSDAPLIGMVTRLTHQKGVDIALEATPMLEDLNARMVLLGSGERVLAKASDDVARDFPDRFIFREGYDERLAHQIFGGSDLYLMPSRFEPAGLTQMQAMRYGSIPVVTDVGGLHDTVTDADSSSTDGTGFIADEVSVTSVSDALRRGVNGWRSTTRRSDIIQRGMRTDWSWQTPASRYVDLYRDLTSAR